MADVKVQSLEQLERLEEKVDEAVRMLVELRTRCESLQKNNAVLQERVETLQHRNIALSREIDQLKAAQEDDGGGREEIIRRIDRMLEKFGELQI
jgi:FtsZ-binding cell division protein ZapB